MRKLRAFGRFWFHFIVGDDWRLALMVAMALVATYLVNTLTEATVWWIVAGAVVVILPLSIRRAMPRRPADILDHPSSSSS